MTHGAITGIHDEQSEAFQPITPNLHMTIHSELATLRLFMNYINDNGIQIQMIAAMIGAVPAYANSVDRADSDTVAEALISDALCDLEMNATDGDYDVTVDKFINGAASLDFLAANARRLLAHVLPREIIPSGEVISAALRLFEQRLRNESEDF